MTTLITAAATVAALITPPAIFVWAMRRPETIHLAVAPGSYNVMCETRPGQAVIDDYTQVTCQECVDELAALARAEAEAAARRADAAIDPRWWGGAR